MAPQQQYRPRVFDRIIDILVQSAIIGALGYMSVIPQMKAQISIMEEMMRDFKSAISESQKRESELRARISNIEGRLQSMPAASRQ